VGIIFVVEMATAVLVYLLSLISQYSTLKSRRLVLFGAAIQIVGAVIWIGMAVASQVLYSNSAFQR
jgi:tryptophan-rich sensory protein